MVLILFVLLLGSSLRTALFKKAATEILMNSTTYSTTSSASNVSMDLQITGKLVIFTLFNNLLVFFLIFINYLIEAIYNYVHTNLMPFIEFS